MVMQINYSPKKSRAVRPLQNLPVGFWVSKWFPYGGKFALAKEARWLLLPGSASESPKMKSAGTSGFDASWLDIGAIPIINADKAARSTVTMIMYGLTYWRHLLTPTTLVIL